MLPKKLQQVLVDLQVVNDVFLGVVGARYLLVQGLLRVD